MGLINSSDAATVHARLTALPAPVTITVYTSASGCGYCEETGGLAHDVAALSDGRVNLALIDVSADPAAAEGRGIDKTPALTVSDAEGRDRGIRFFGIPAGFEFVSLLETIEMVSRGDSGLSLVSRERLRSVAEPLPLQVFVTPACPYCPSAVLLAFRMAMEWPKITACMVEAAEFPDLAARYNVTGVPHTVIGWSATPMLGTQPEAEGVRMVVEAARALRG
jgi:glutaredoxin-like protein